MEKILEFTAQDKLQALVNNWARVAKLGAKVREYDGSVICSSAGCPEPGTVANAAHSVEDIFVGDTKVGSIFITEIAGTQCENYADSAKLLTMIVSQLVESSYEKKCNAKRAELMSEGIAKCENLVGVIQDKTKSLNGIQGRQNILALNASIEAARAGDAGKGFAVVAKEVGNLSMQSKELNEEISKTILDISKAVHNMTSDTDAE